MQCLHVKSNYFDIILKLFHCFIPHVTTNDGHTWNGHVWNKTMK